MSVRCAIRHLDLAPCYEAELEHHDPIELVLLSFDDYDSPLHVIMFDLMSMSFDRCTELRQALAAALSCGPEQFIIHCTHTHTGVRDEDVEFNLLIPMLCTAIKANLEQAQEASMAYVEVDTQGRWNVNRRKQLPHDMGKMCVWSGCEETADGRLDATRVVRHRLKDWFGEDFDHPDFAGPYYYDEDDRDTLLQQLIFQNKDGELIGSLVRFACHPPIAGHTTHRRYSADFPGFVRRYLQETWGGNHAYLTGPCGNIMPWEQGEWQDFKFSDHVASGPPLSPFIDVDGPFKELQRIAREMVETLTEHRPLAAAFEPLDSIDFKLRSIELPIRDDFVWDDSARDAESQEIWDRLEANDNLSFAEYKHLADRMTFLGYHHLFKARGYIDDEVLSRGTVSINLPVFRLNNVVIQGAPGESFWETAVPAQEKVQAQDFRFMSFSFANGSITYLPSDEERVHGDYETCYCVVAEGAVGELAQQLMHSSLDIVTNACS